MFIYAVVTLLSACVVGPSYQEFWGGERVYQPGVSFELPAGKSWVALIRTTYQAAIGTRDMPPNETLIVATSVYDLPGYANKEEFLQAVKQGRAAEPATGRFEKISLVERLYDARPETCVFHQSASNDYGVEAKRGGQYTVYETFGMNCMHPDYPAVGILVELSRKAPPGTTFPEFETMGSFLLQSVQFGEF
jgi:hypothetical protein